MKIDTISFYQTARQVIGSGRAVTFHASGGSMRPFLADGEEVTLAGAESYRRGDIVLAQTSAGGKVVLHYVVVAREGGYELMGAANLVQREWCVAADVAGRLVSPSVSRWRVVMWHRLLPLRRYLLHLFP